MVFPVSWIEESGVTVTGACAFSGGLIRRIDHPLGKAAHYPYEYGWANNKISASGTLVVVDWGASIGSKLYIMSASNLKVQTIINLYEHFETSSTSFYEHDIDGYTVVVGERLTERAMAFHALTGELLYEITSPFTSGTPNFGTAVSIDGAYVAIGAGGEDSAGNNNGKVAIFNSATGAYIRTIDNPRAGGSTSDSFGYHNACLHGDMLLVEALYEDISGFNNGIVYQFSVSTGGLVREILNPNPAGTSDIFGRGIGTNGSIIAISCSEEDNDGTNNGIVYTFSASTGSLLNTIHNPNYADGINDKFGWVLSMDGNIIVVASPNEDADGVDVGRAYTFNATTGQLIATIQNPSPDPFIPNYVETPGILGNSVFLSMYYHDTLYKFDATTGAVTDSKLSLDLPDYEPFENYFAEGCDINDKYIVAGVPGDGVDGADTGRVYVFNASDFSLRHTIVNPNLPKDVGEGWSWFGGSNTELYGDMLLVGDNTTYTNGHYAGIAYIFSAKTGALLHTLQPPVPSADEFFANRVDIDANYAVVAASSNDADAPNSGRVYVFNVATGSHVATITNPTVASDDLFGASVAIEDGKILVGCPYDDTVGPNKGAAYLFDAATGNLIQTYLSPLANPTIRFGSTVTLSEGIAVIGAAEGTESVAAFEALSGDLLYKISTPPEATGARFSDTGKISANNGLLAIGATGIGIVYVYNLYTGALLHTLVHPEGDPDADYGWYVTVYGNRILVGADYDPATGEWMGSMYLYG